MENSKSEYLEQLKQKLMPFLKDYLESHNVRLGPGGQFRCINPDHEDKRPSMGFVAGSKEQVFNCFTCMPEGELVRCDKNIKRIEDVSEGELIYTASGELGTVIRRVKLDGSNKEIYKFTLGNISHVNQGFTHDHKMLVVKDVISNVPYIKNEKDRLFGKFYSDLKSRERSNKYKNRLEIQELDAKYVTIGDYFVFPQVNSFIEIDSLENKWLKKRTRGPKTERVEKIPINKDTMWLFGIFCAEGNTYRGGINFTFHKNETYYANKVKKIIETYTGKKVIISQSDPSKQVLRVRCSSTDLEHFFVANFGCGAENKTAPYNFVRYNLDLQKAFMDGVFDGDGCKKTGVLKVISLSLVSIIQQIVVNLSLPYSIRKESAHIDKNGLEHKDAYLLRLLKLESCKCFYEEINCIKYCLQRVDAIAITEPQDNVYDITVSGSSCANTFLALNYAVHNCGAKGTIIDAAHLLEGKPTTGKEFIFDNLFYLADKYAITYNQDFEVTEEEMYERQVYRAYREAADIISENQPLEYLKKRNWPVSLCREHQIGSVKSFDDFITKLANRGFTRDFLRDIDMNPRIFDPSMLIFTVKDEKGRVVGFAGRDMSWTKGSSSFKFQNTSSKCSIYHKSKILYGLHIGKNTTPPLYVFEGYPDWVAAQKHGLTNCCAIGGTALTYEHINLIKKLGIREVVLCLDGDKYGQEKTEKLLDGQFSGEESIRVKIVKLPSDKETCDPDDFLDKEGLEGFQRLPRMDAFEWRLSRFPYDFDKVDVCERMIPLILNEPNNIKREGMCKQLSEFSGVRLKAIQRQLDNILNYEEAQIKQKEDAHVRSVMNEIKETDSDPAILFETAAEEIKKLRSTHSEDLHSEEELISYMEEVRDKFDTREPGLLGFETGWELFDEAFSGIPKEDVMITFAGDANVGKCKKFDTPVLLADGSYKTIEDIYKDKTERIMTMDGHSIAPAKVSDWIDSGVLKCFKLCTKSGLTDESSETHPYYTVNGWRNIKDLKVGDKIAVSRNYNIDNDNVIKEWQATLLGLLLADGSITRGVGFCNIDEELINLYKNIIISNFGKGYHFRSENCITYASKDNATKNNKNEITEMLRNFGVYGKNSHNKFIPDEIFKSSDSIISKFLGAFYACDGWVCTTSTKNNIEVGVTLCNERMVRQIYSLLLRLGIKSSVRKSVSTCDGKTFDRFSIAILDKNSIIKFHNEINIPIEHKQNLLSSFCESEGVVSRGAYRLNYPCELWDYIKSVCKKKGIAFSDLLNDVCKPVIYFCKSRNKYRTKKYNIRFDGGINPGLLKRMSLILDDEFLISLCAGDIIFDEIISIEDIGKHKCYDLTVPKTHNFIANDIVVHNTGLMFNIAYRLAMNNKDILVLFMSIDDSRQQAIPRLVALSAGLQIRQVTHPTEFITNDEDREKLEAGWKQIMELINTNRFSIKDVSQGTTLNFAENWIRWNQDKYPDKKVIFFLDNFHKLSDEYHKDERIRFKHASARIHQMKNKLHISAVCTMEIRKFIGKRPMLADIAECVTGDTLLTDGETGLQIPIKDIEVGRKVISMIEPGVSGAAKVVNKFYKGKNRVFNLITRSGRMVRATENHPFFTPDGWISLKHLEPGNSVTIPSDLSFNKCITYDSDLCRFLGYLAGDGTYRKHQSIGFINKDNEIIDDVISIVKHKFDTIKISERDCNGSRDLRFTIPKKMFFPGSNAMRNWMNSMGVEPSKDENKTVPGFLFECDECSVLNYISGIIATDGTITKAGGKYNRIQISSISRKLLIGVQTLMWKIGIKSTVSFAGYDSEKSTSSIFVLSVSSDSCVDLCKRINIRGKKGRLAREIIEEVRGHTNPGPGVLPIEFTQRAESLRIKRGMPRVFKNGYINQGKRMKYDTAKYLSEQLDDDILRTWSNSGFWWDEIVSIVECGIEDVFDIEVEGCHNFVANGIVIHNSKQMEFDNNMIGMIYNDMHARRQNADVIWMEEKNGQQVKKPIVEIDIQKNKITDFKGTLYYKFSPEYSVFYECSEDEVDEFGGMYKRALKQIQDRRNPEKPDSPFMSSREVGEW